MYLADHAKLSFAEAAARLKDAGVRWITDWVRGIVTEVPVTHVTTGDPFTFLRD